MNAQDRVGKAALIMAGILVLLAAAVAAEPVHGAPHPEAARVYTRVIDLEKRGEYVEAARWARELVDLEPSSDLYLAYASHVERLACEYGSGLRHALAAVRLNPSVAWYQASVAFNAYGARDLERARQYCRRVLDLGEAQAGRGNCDRARWILEALEPRAYDITWILKPGKGVANDGLYYIPIPTTNLPYQVARADVSGVGKSRRADLEGNDIVTFRSLDGQDLRLAAHVQTQPYAHVQELSRRDDGAPIPEDAAAYLGASEGIDPKSAILRAVVARLGRADRLGTVRSILLWMKRNLRYEVVDFHNVEEILARGHGECGGWSAVFVGLCRVAGIPARAVWGVIEEPAGARRFAPPGHLKGHMWAEFYLAGAGWIPVEPQDVETVGLLPTTYVRMHHHDMHGHRWSTDRFRASENMVIMGGDTPAYRRFEGKP